MKTKPTKRKPRVPKAETFERLDTAVAQCQSRRRSIPAQEVDEMLEQQAKELEHKPTVYDCRAAALNKFRFFLRHQEELKAQLSEAKVQTECLRNQIKELDDQITFELRIDQVR